MPAGIISRKITHQWTLENLPLDLAAAYSYEKLRQPKKYCQNCKITEDDAKLFQCSGCCKTPLRIYYCNKGCQRTAWKTHKAMCQTSRILYKDYAPTALQMKAGKQDALMSACSYGANINSYPIIWAAAQAFKNNPRHDPTKTCVEITLEPTKWNMFPNSFYPVNYHFRALTDTENIMISHKHTLHNKCSGYYQIIDGRSPVTPIIEDYMGGGFDKSLLLPIPQWPYVVAQVCLENSLVPFCALTKLYLLTTTVLEHNGEGGILSRFATRINGTWSLRSTNLSEWKEITGDVLALD